MKIKNSICGPRRPHIILPLIFSLFAAPALAQDAEVGLPTVLDAVGGNSANNQVFYLDFLAETAVRIDDDATGRSSLRSFEFFKNTCAKRLDLVAADTNRGELLLYQNSVGAEIVNSCDNGSCPARPDGLSSSNERLMAVADTGTARTIPALWFYEPRDCDAGVDDPWPFKTPKTGGQLLIGTGGAATPVTGIADTEFVKVLGGGLNAGDLLVITAGPAAIARVPREDISALLNGGGSLAAAQILADESDFGGQEPTGMAFVPGTAGIGSASDNLSESEDLLVTLSGGTVLKLTFKQDAQLARTVVAESFLEGLGNGALGIAAGTRDDDTFMVIADRNQGKFLRYTLDVVIDDDDGAVSLALSDEMPRTIASDVQNPQGVAFNSDAYDASKCDASQGGCRIRRTVDLEFTQDLQTQATFSTIFANIFVVPDTRRGRGETLKLSEVSSEFDDRLEVPASCTGFSLPDDPNASVLVVLNINNDVEITPGEFVQTRELVNQIIPQLGDCSDTGARLFYHPDAFGTTEPEQGVLYDTTYSCKNPSRSISREYSPVVICADAFYGALNTKGKGSFSKKAIQAEVNQRADHLQAVVAELAETNPVLADTLFLRIENARQFVKRSDYLAVSAEFNAGAEHIAASKDAFTGLGYSGRASLYGDLLGRFLALAFFTRESLSGGDFPFSLADSTIICGVEGGLEGCPQPGIL